MLYRPDGRVPSLPAQVPIGLFRLRGTPSVRAEIRRDKQPKILSPYSFRFLVVTDPLGRSDSKERAHGGKRR